jgi:hypothetical protein
MFHPMSLLGDVGILLLTLFLGLYSIDLNKKKIAALSFLLVVLVSVVSFQRHPVTLDTSSITLDQLRSLPYVHWSDTDVVKESGVVTHDPHRAYPGYNFYPDPMGGAYVMDMDGRVVREWRFSPLPWDYTELLDNGEILALILRTCFGRIDSNSKNILVKHIPAHHDIEILPDGTYLVPIYDPPVLYNSRLVEFDSLLRVSTTGETLDRWSTFSHLETLKTLYSSFLLDTKPRQYLSEKLSIQVYLLLEKTYFFTKSALIKPSNSRTLEEAKQRILTLKPGPMRAYVRELIGVGPVYDYFHLNYIGLLPETELGKKDKRFQKGNYLMCLRNVNLVLILDKETKNIVWSWGPGVLDWPHTPSLLDNGNILIFDNGTHRSYSRVLEINPVTGGIEWEYKADPPEDFFSPYWGSSQRLPNGNTLICESKKGRAFEVTPQGEIVWEFFNPALHQGRRKAIYRIQRFSEEIEQSLGISKSVDMRGDI